MIVNFVAGPDSREFFIQIHGLNLNRWKGFVKMPECQAFNCTNIRGKAKTSFHQFPNPQESRAEKARCRR